MADRAWQKKFISLLAVFFLLFVLPCSASAESERKGFSAAEGTELDRSTYVDASEFENRAPDVKTVKIGLQYGENATGEAVFLDAGEQGFAFGSYDADRIFVPSGRTGIDCVLVVGAYSGARTNIQVLSAYDHSLLYETDAGVTSLAIMPLGGEEDPQTWFTGKVYRGGFECRINEFQRMTVINYVELEDYVRGVVPYEMSPDWPLEALKAQAVCARTYVVYNQNACEDEGFDISDDTESQVYNGLLRADSLTDEAVKATEGEYVRYQGEICEIYYFAADGGATEDGKNMFDSDRPYLLGKIDPFESAVDYSYRDWELWFTGENLMYLLHNKGFDIGEIVSLKPVYSAMGNVIGLHLYDGAGNDVFLQGRDAYTTVLLHNCRYRVERQGVYFYFHGDGWGHSCGMSQWGARAMASVYGYDYQDIIRFYFTGAYIA